ncbi:MAG TPA: undecaprenyldiphospho-muramoylpentapeptide beta-N-acetylglucosaminyltransferase [Chitinophagaceae bacterium]|nr:undecaprenyldiphospho-muramoylpentapeptide beta-N-acetylglucosaminyltransferase [Chitinophagaceae bacterium]
MSKIKNNNTLQNSASGVGGIIIAGGGTGGHIFPAIAIANAIKQLQPNIEILFVGANGKMEMEKVPQAGYRIKGIDIAGFNRSSLIKNIGLPFKLIKSFFQVRKIINSFKPVAVIGVGGYSSFPVLKYAQSKNIKTFIHESNSFAGKSNIMLAKNATMIFVASDGMQKFFPKDKIVVTGNPVRKSIAESKITKSEAINFFGLDENKKTLFVVGGSLGAKSINDVIAAHLSEIEKLNVQLIWQIGKNNSAAYLNNAKEFKNVFASEFIKEMEMAYAAADTVISRSGAMSVTELCVSGKAVVFVPFPHAAEDHQTSNAKNLVDKNAALMVKDSEAKEKLFSVAIELLFDDAMQQQLKQNIKLLAVNNADEIIAEEIVLSISPERRGKGEA